MVFVKQSSEVVANALGQLHHVAHDCHLRGAMPNAPIDADDVLIPAFDEPRRRTALLAMINQGCGTLLTRTSVETLFATAPAWPAAVYKDCNPRNFIIPEQGPVVLIDFDDLTLAPFGYDLAKPIVTTAMTYGPLSSALISAALSAYNHPLTASQQCPAPRLAAFCETHHVLTAAYLGRGGYTHQWPEIRPWKSMEAPW